MSDKAPNDQSHDERAEGSLAWRGPNFGVVARTDGKLSVEASRAPEPDGRRDPAPWLAWLRAEKEAARNADIPTRLSAIHARLHAASPGPWGTCHVRSDGSLCSCGLIWGSGDTPGGRP